MQRVGATTVLRASTRLIRGSQAPPAALPARHPASTKTTQAKAHASPYSQALKTQARPRKFPARAASLDKPQLPGASIAQKGGSLKCHRQPHAYSAVLVEHRTSRVPPTAFLVCRDVMKTNTASPLAKPAGEIQSTRSKNRRAARIALKVITQMAKPGKLSVQNVTQAKKCLPEPWAHVFVSLAIPAW